ncbi:MAG: cytochrome C oxidase subunit IV family protein [Gemmatimonadota bacterium]
MAEEHGHGTVAASAATEERVAHAAPNYYLIWLYLLIMTVAEVVVAFVSHLPETWLILILLVLAVWKAALVAMYYMHLKFEPPRLVLLIMAALPLAILLSLTVVTMEGW